jgi:hypothetical protein
VLFAAVLNNNGFKGRVNEALYTIAAWNLVHAMLTGQPAVRETFNDYLVAVNRGEDARAAWGAALLTCRARRGRLRPCRLRTRRPQSFSTPCGGRTRRSARNLAPS